MSVIDLNQTLMSFVEMYKQLNQTASEIGGIDTHWMRAIPHENSEDVIFHEYTLHDVECPKVVRVVATNSSYNPGNFNIDYFGINYEAPLEIVIDTKTWTSVYGEDCMPQQHDIVYFDPLNCLYEVASSTIEYGFASQETGFKVQLTKFNPRANVRLNPGVEDTINDLTVSEQELFGEQISRDIADIVDEEETSQMLNTSEPNQDKFKTVDLESINIKDIDTKDNTVARSYYDLRYMEKSIIYNNGDVVQKSSRKPYRFFSCWFNLCPTTEPKEMQIDSLEYEKGKYYLNGDIVGKNLKDGTEIKINRGAFLHLNAIVNKTATLGGKERYLVTFNNSEFRDMTKKVTNWNQNLTVSTTEPSDIHSMLLGRTEGECNFNISLVGDSVLLIKFGNKMKKVGIAPIPRGEWCAICLNLGEQSDMCLFTKNSKQELILTQKAEMGDLSNDFNVGEFYIPQSDTFLTNIRLYQSKGHVEENIMEKDINSQLARNNSDAVIIDNAAVPNKSPYIAEQR